MFLYQSLIIFLIAVIFAGKGKRNIANPMIIFSGLWLLIIYLSNLHLFGLLMVSSNTYELIFWGIFAFTLGCLILQVTQKYIYLETSQSNFSYELRYSFLYVIAVITIVFFLNNFLNSLISIISGSSLDNIRVQVQNRSGTSTLYNLVYNFVVLPSATLLEAVAVADFYVGKRDKKLLILTITIVLMRSIADGGRTPLFNFVLYFIVGFLILKSNGTSFKFNFAKNKANIIFSMLVGIILLVWMTFSRTGSTVTRQLYFYFSMSPVLLEYWKGIVQSSNIYTYGLTSFNGLFYVFSLFSKTLVGTTSLIQESYNLISQTDSMWQAIAQGGVKANAYVSSFWFLYTDFRTIGVIIGMFLYGIINMREYLRVIGHISIRRFTVYLLLFQGLFFSFIRFPFSKPYYCLAFVYLFIFAYKKTK